MDDFFIFLFLLWVFCCAYILIRKFTQKRTWYGKIIYFNEGIVYSIEGTKAECESFVKGFEYAKEQAQDADGSNQLEDYWTCVDQLKAKDE